MNWLSISSINEWEQLLAQNNDSAVAVFKHSTRCSISSMAKNRLESSWEKKNPDTPIYLIDLISNRKLSNEIASSTGVEHQSPQLIILKNGEAIYNASHISISSASASKHI